LINSLSPTSRRSLAFRGFLTAPTRFFFSFFAPFRPCFVGGPGLLVRTSLALFFSLWTLGYSAFYFRFSPNPAGSLEVAEPTLGNIFPPHVFLPTGGSISLAYFSFAPATFPWPPFFFADPLIFTYHYEGSVFFDGVRRLIVTLAVPTATFLFRCPRGVIDPRLSNDFNWKNV